MIATTLLIGMAAATVGGLTLLAIEILSLVRETRKAGREEITEEELDRVFDELDEGDADVTAAIARRRMRERASAGDTDDEDDDAG